MSEIARIFLYPLIVCGIVAALIIGIGSLLLAVGKVMAVPLAFGLAVLVMAVCTFLATRAPAVQGNH